MKQKRKGRAKIRKTVAKAPSVNDLESLSTDASGSAQTGESKHQLSLPPRCWPCCRMVDERIRSRKEEQRRALEAPSGGASLARTSAMSSTLNSSGFGDALGRSSARVGC